MKNLSRTLNAGLVGIALSSLTMVLPVYSQVNNSPDNTTTSPNTTTTTTDYNNNDDGFDLGWLGLLGLIGLAGLRRKPEHHTSRHDVSREPSTTNYTDYR
jgi:MYXO-CTERM domain-containing protein